MPYRVAGKIKLRTFGIKKGLCRLLCKRVLFPIVAGVLLGSHFAPVAFAQGIDLKVTVTDCSTSQPISQANVMVVTGDKGFGGEKQAFTNSLGKARIYPLFPGDKQHVVRVTHRDYESKQVSRRMRSNEKVNMEICLIPKSVPTDMTEVLVPSPSTPSAYVEKELLVHFNEDITKAQINTIIQQLGTQIIQIFDAFGIYHLRIVADADTVQTVQTCQSLQIGECDFNGIWSLSSTPNDTQFNSQWPLNAQVDQGIIDIGIQTAWDAGFTSSKSVAVAVLDSGVDGALADLKNNIQFDLKLNYNVFDGDIKTSDEIGHGTFVSSIIGALGNNKLGISGVNWEATIVPLKVVENFNFFERRIKGILDYFRGVGPWDAFISALDQVKTYNETESGKRLPIKVVNISAGGGNSGLLERVIGEMLKQDILLVVSAGNNDVGKDVDVDSDSIFPCKFTHPKILCVAATTKTGQLAAFSNFGNTSVDLAAPGEQVPGLLPTGIKNGDSGTLLSGTATSRLENSDIVASSSGTSFSAAYVSGVVALLFSVCPNYDATRVKEVLLESTIPLKSSLEGMPSNAGDGQFVNGHTLSTKKKFGYLHWPDTLPSDCESAPTSTDATVKRTNTALQLANTKLIDQGGYASPSPMTLELPGILSLLARTTTNWFAPIKKHLENLFEVL